METKESTLPTLRWKKTIGILAIILGGLRFITGVDTYIEIAKAEKLITGYDSLSDMDGKLKFLVSFSKVMLPLTLAILATIFILGIVLLCVEQGLNDKMPRPKSRRICVEIFLTTVVYLFMEVFTYAITVSFTDEISLLTIIGSLGFIGVLIVFCIAGLTTKTQQKNSLLIEKAEPHYSAQGYANIEEIDAQPEPTPLSPLDTEIEQLKKAIEKRKLEKELQQVNAEKQAEIEQLKKELAELE